MTLAVEAVLWLLIAILLVPLAVLVLESLAGLLPARTARRSEPHERVRCVVLIPAHDEEAGIGRTVTHLQKQLRAGDRLLVVADNCTDGTAQTARSRGAAVLERTDLERRGKGYALDHGVRHLEQDPPEVLVIVDADCLVGEGTLDRLVQAASTSGRPVQAPYVMDLPPQPRRRDQLSAFAFVYKNVVRPRGLDRLGLPCLLTGTGMAFPWVLLQKAALASGNIVEDMQLGIDLAVAGHPPRLCPEALVSGELPAGSNAAVKQRTRWEHGHLQTLLTQVPRLARAALRQRRLDLLGLALELSVPPLSMLFLLWSSLLAVSLAWWLLAGSLFPALVLASAGAAAVFSILTAWARFGRDRLPLSSLLTVPLYVLWKVPIYLTFLVRRQQAWVRTERTSPTKDVS